MRCGIFVEARGIGIEQRARVFGETRIFAFGKAARIEQVIGVVEGCTLFARDRAIAPAAHRDDILQREEIVLGMRYGDAVSDIGIGLPVDMGDAEIVADDFGRIDSPGQGDIVALGPEGFPSRKTDEHDQSQHHQRNADAPQPFCHRFPSSLATRLASAASRRNAIGQNRFAAVPRSGSCSLTSRQ